MKNLLLLFLSIYFTQTIIAQKDGIKTMSYAQLFEMIEVETDSVFHLEKANIIYNPDSDQRYSRETELQDTVIINKSIRLNDVIFDGDGILKYFHFKKEVRFDNCVLFYIEDCIFDGSLVIYNYQNIREDYIQSGDRSNLISLTSSQLNFGLFIYHAPLKNLLDQSSIYYEVINNTVKGKDAPVTGGPRKSSVIVSILSALGLNFQNNKIYTADKGWEIGGFFLEKITINRNSFHSTFPGVLTFDKIEDLECTENQFNQKVELELSGINDDHVFYWKDFSNRLVNQDYFLSSLSTSQRDEYASHPDSIIQLYRDSISVQDPLVYQGEMSLLSKFYNYYRKIHNSESANAVYMEMKDLETKRLSFLNADNTSFENYFTWKVNQFLKVFSAYGTKPARAIIFSLYVILFFALIYLFFPNSWDSHGKNRIINRYKFFGKYMSQDSGIHEVYQEDKKEELLSYEQFKSIMQSYENKIPKFFTATAFPLYKWAVSGTKLTSAFLKRIDIIQGTWSELPASKRWWKGLLLIGAFTVAIAYDIIIKMLNALMLSINTFTTLGFGEIPIKGLPRYLAIIQGFIGWFMLTIFSVSLISQLLN